MPTRWQRLRRFLFRLLLAVAVPASLLLAWVALGLRHGHDHADCIFVPGAAVWRNRQPSDALEYRLQHALHLYRQGRAPVIVVAGGGSGNYAEAEVMAEWLIEKACRPMRSSRKPSPTPRAKTPPTLRPCYSNAACAARWCASNGFT